MLSFADILKIPLHELVQQKLRPVKVAVLDTGIDASHEALKGKVLRAFGFQRNEAGRSESVSLPRTANNDPSGHGTGAAAIIGTLAPNARFIDYRVLDADNGGYGSTVVKGLEEAIDSDADVINMSVAYRKDRYWEQTAQLLEKAYLANKIVVASKRNIPLPGDLGLPAELSNAISVDIGEYRNPFVFRFLRNSAIEFSAHGVAVLTAKSGGGYIRMTGTSFATPTIAAFCALLRGTNPDLKLFEIKSILRHCACESRKKEYLNIANPLECAPDTYDSRYQQVEYKCSTCGHVSEVPDAFPQVCCSKCGHVGHRPVLLDPRLYVNIIEEIKQIVSPQYRYHNWEHARDTVEAVYEILRHYRKLSIWKKRSLLMAALLHDYGFSVSKENHEEEGARLASAICRECGYSSCETNLVVRLILATKEGYRPKSLEEKIIRDADMFHIGTTRQKDVSRRIRHELQEFGLHYSDAEWRRLDRSVVSSHRFYLNWLMDAQARRRK